MTPHTHEDPSTGLIERNPFVIAEDTIPPRDPEEDDDDEEEEEEDEEEEDEDEAPVVREPDED
jgi:hypothetical protein